MSKVTTKQVFAVADQIRAEGYLVGQAYDPFKPHQLVLPKPATNMTQTLTKITDVNYRPSLWIVFNEFHIKKERALLRQAERREDAYKKTTKASGMIALLLAGTGAYKSTQNHSVNAVGPFFIASGVAVLTSVLCFMAARRTFRAATNHRTQQIIHQDNISALEALKEQAKRSGSTTPTVQLPG